MKSKTEIIFALTLILALFGTGMAQPTKPVGPTVVRLTLHPMATSQPVLQYPLLPPLTQMRQGDASYNYAWAALAMPSHKIDGKQVMDLFQQVSDSDRKSFSVSDASAVMAQIDNQHVHDAARCENAHWDSDFRNQGIYALLPYLNYMRQESESVSIEERLALTKGDFHGLTTACKPSSRWSGN